MVETIVFTSIIIGILVLLLGFKVFFVKGGKFPHTHVEGNKDLLDKGITCAKSQDRIERERKNLNELIKK